jgi:archaellum component FlaC
MQTHSDSTMSESKKVYERMKKWLNRSDESNLDKIKTFKTNITDTINFFKDEINAIKMWFEMSDDEHHKELKKRFSTTHKSLPF